MTDAAAELKRIRAGADPTPIDEGAVMSPAQFWHRLLEDEPDRRMRRLERMLTAAADGSSCWILNHPAELERVGGELERVGGELARLRLSAETREAEQ